MNMKKDLPLVKFISMTNSDEKLVDYYTTIRTWLQREGYTTESSKRINGAPAYIWDARDKVTSEIEKLKRDLNNYGIFDLADFNNYIESKLKEIDKKFPLVDEL